MGDDNAFFIRPIGHGVCLDPNDVLDRLLGAISSEATRSRSRQGSRH
jgi:hypothetical protein